MKCFEALMMLAAGLAWFACGPAVETVKPPAAVVTKEEFYAVGNRFYAEQQFDSAEVYLKKASAMDPSYLAPLDALARMHYALGIQHEGERNPVRLEHFRKAFEYFATMESRGANDSEVYERLSDLSNTLGDHKALVKYSEKNAAAYPYERQYVNLGYAYFQSGDFQSVIKTQKQAIEKFKGSTYIGSFYRQLGRAYMKVDRDQTAERTFDAGLKEVDAVINNRLKSDGKFKTSLEYRRLVDDKTGMLVSLKGLHQTYHASEKLQKVEQQLRELGYSK